MHGRHGFVYKHRSRAPKMEPLVPPSGLQQNIPEEKSEALKIDLWFFILFFLNLQFTCFYTVQLPLCAQQTKMIIV